MKLYQTSSGLSKFSESSTVATFIHLPNLVVHKYIYIYIYTKVSWIIHSNNLHSIPPPPNVALPPPKVTPLEEETSGHSDFRDILRLRGREAKTVQCQEDSAERLGKKRAFIFWDEPQVLT